MNKKLSALIISLSILTFSACGETEETQLPESDNISETQTTSEEVTESTDNNEISPASISICFGNNEMEISEKDFMYLDTLKNLDFTRSDFSVTDTSNTIATIKINYETMIIDNTEKYLIFPDAVGYISSEYNNSIQFVQTDSEFYSNFINQLMPLIAENTFFYGENISYSEYNNNQGSMIDKYSDIINSKIYSEYFIENDTVHNLDVFNEWTSCIEFTNQYYYDIIENNSIGYERNNDYDVFQKVEITPENHRTAFISDIIDNYSFSESRCFTAYNAEYACEKYISDNNCQCLLYFRDGNLEYALQFKDNEFHVIMNYCLYEYGEMLSEKAMSEHFQHCENNVYDDNSDDFEYSFEYNVNNVFDFDAERIRGENIENPHIVESYREFFDTAGEFSIYITAKRGNLMMYDYATKSGENYYTRSGLQKAGEKNIVTEDIEIDNRHYSRCCYEDEIEDYTLYGDADYADIYIYYIIQNNDRPEFDDVDEFVEAYNVTINNEEYICEVWHAGVTDFNVYCKDGKVIAIDTIFYNEHEQSVIEYIYDYAEPENIKEPEIYNSYAEEVNQ